MDDQMMDMMAGDAMLLRRLEAYAELRLSPDLTTSSRLRARVLAVAHRQASLARADAALTLLAPPVSTAALQLPTGVSRGDGFGRVTRGRRARWQRAAAVVLAASLGAGIVAGGAAAARPGGPLYETRLWAETLTLPSDPSARVVAELGRLTERLREIGEASRSGDTGAVAAALAAYDAITAQASASAILAGDEVATAVLETGIGRNIEVLQALVTKVPDNASAAITRALDAAIARSAGVIDRMHARHPGGGRGDGDGGGAPATRPDPTPRATRAPTAKPTRAPVSTPEATPKSTPKPKPTHKPAATAVPTDPPARTPKPRSNQGDTKPEGAPAAPGGGSEDEGD